MSRRLTLVVAAALTLAVAACSSPTAPSSASTRTPNMLCGAGHTSGSGTRC